jgi:hypothetical protein
MPPLDPPAKQNRIEQSRTNDKIIKRRGEQKPGNVHTSSMRLLSDVPLTPRCLGAVMPLAIRSSATAMKSS